MNVFVGLTLGRLGYISALKILTISQHLTPRGSMSSAYLPVLILLGVSVVNAVGMVVASQVLNPRRPRRRRTCPTSPG
jgi:hypothetical protein